MPEESSALEAGMADSDFGSGRSLVSWEEGAAGARAGGSFALSGRGLVPSGVGVAEPLGGLKPGYGVGAELGLVGGGGDVSGGGELGFVLSTRRPVTGDDAVVLPALSATTTRRS